MCFKHHNDRLSICSEIVFGLLLLGVLASNLWLILR